MVHAVGSCVATFACTLALLCASLAVAQQQATVNTSTQGSQTASPSSSAVPGANGPCKDLTAMMAVKKLIAGLPSPDNITTCPCQGSKVAWDTRKFSCNSEGRVVYMELSGQNVTGDTTLPESMTDLTELKELYMRYIPLRTLPSWFSGLSKLEKLYLNYMQMEGLSDVLAQLPNLSWLITEGNNMTAVDGKLPLVVTAMKKLKLLYFYPDPQYTGLPRGSVPAEYSTMTQLESLALGYNLDFQGEVPTWLSAMTGLKLLDISNGRITGTLPDWISSMTRLEWLSFQRNNLTGSLPESYSNLVSLRQFLAAQNPGLTGTLPASWSTMSNITLMRLFGTNIGGTLPAAWSNWRNLGSLLLNSMSLTGTIPEQYTAWRDTLRTLYLGDNKLTGPLPIAWSGMKKLTTMGLANTNLEGTLPKEWSALTQLDTIALGCDGARGNLTGTLPVEWSNLTKLIILDVHNQRLSGGLPDAWGLWGSTILKIDAASSGIQGTLPPSWSNMTSLVAVSLAGNKLSGSLPAEWSTMRKAAVMSLGSNQLSGSLPVQWSTMNDILKIDVSGNKLSGSLPSEWSTLYQLSLLDVSNNSLAGVLPAQAWRVLNNLTYIGFHDNPQLCASTQCYVDLTQQASSGGFRNLTHVSGPGGQPITSSWCTPPEERKGRAPPLLLYVGVQPHFDYCMKDVCLAEYPERYNISWLDSFSLEGSLASQGSAAAAGVTGVGLAGNRSQQDPDDAIKRFRNFPAAEYQLAIQQTLGNLTQVVKAAGDGWLVGSGGWYDPCLDRQGIINTIILFGVFFFLVCVIVGDYLLQMKTSAGITRRLGWLIMGRNGGRIIAYRTKGKVPLITRIARVLHEVMLYATTAVDLGTDIYLVVLLLPNKVAYMLLAALLVCDLLSAGAMVQSMFRYQAQLASSSAGGKQGRQLTRINATCLAIFSMPGPPGTLLRTLLFILLVPLVSVSMHVVALVLAVVAVVEAFRGRPTPRWNFGGLDPAKSAIFRSFVVGWLEAPCSIAFTTFAYLVPRKVLVGTYIDSTAFFISLGFSMFHVLLEMWETKELLVRNHGSLGAALREVCDVRAEQPGAAGTDDPTNAVVGSPATIASGQPPAETRTAVAVTPNAVQGMEVLC